MCRGGGEIPSPQGFSVISLLWVTLWSFMMPESINTTLNIYGWYLLLLKITWRRRSLNKASRWKARPSLGNHQGCWFCRCADSRPQALEICGPAPPSFPVDPPRGAFPPEPGTVGPSNPSVDGAPSPLMWWGFLLHRGNITKYYISSSARKTVLFPPTKTTSDALLQTNRQGGSDKNVPWKSSGRSSG